ncbi:MAG: hypothetical protein M1827_005241 [Pycnora praestabilis]|nr:MAG: hypothetical protein M1827_005241 [Pycnora praestabilis]
MEETMYFRDTMEGVEVDEGVESGTETPSTKEKIPAMMTTSVETPPRITIQRTSFPPPRTYRQKLALFRAVPGCPSNKQLLTMMYRPLLIFLYFPCTDWAEFLYGTSARYHFTTQLVGCAYLSAFTGAGLGSLWSGLLADKSALWFARRNHGVRESEHRLRSLIFPGLVGSSGLILWGCGADAGVHVAGLIITMAMTTFFVACDAATAISYNVDCFKDLGSETIIMIIIIRNTLGFAVSYAITPWLTNRGLTKCFIAVGMVCLGCTSTFLLLTYFGKKLRRCSAPKYWQYVATSEVCGKLLKSTIHSWLSSKRETSVSVPQLNSTIVFSIGPGAARQELHRDDVIHHNRLPKISLDEYKIERDTGIGLFVAGKNPMKANGATRFIPRSHLWGDEHPDEDLAFFAELNPGDAFIMLSSCFHGGSANTTTDEERLISSCFMTTKGFLRQVENQYLSNEIEQFKE